MTKADAIVVGGGPAGTSAAGALATSGAQVLLLEEHSRVGAPCHCAGLVSPRTLELAELDPERSGLRQYRRARVWGPLGSVAWLESDRVQAVAINRPEFDRHLARLAREAGARIRLGLRAHQFERNGAGGIVVVAANGKGPEKLAAPILIGADGVRSQVARWLDDKTHPPFVPAIKADIRFSGVGTEDIEIFVGNSIAPGWFGWIIPLGDGCARVGIGARSRRTKGCFRRFLGEVRGKFGEFEILSQRGWLIPMAPRQRISFDNALLVGDAARQAKPSSGGGIYMGMRAGELAAEASLHALAHEPSREWLGSYERAWQSEEGEELQYNHWLRTIYNRMDDQEIDRMVDLCNRPWAQLAIGHLGDIDFASRLFRPVHLALERVAPGLLGRLSERLHAADGGSIAADLATLDLDADSLMAEVQR